MNEQVSDERLMERLIGGEQQSLAELMDRWQGPIWCFIERMCGRLGATEDIYQEVWTRLYLYRRNYRPERPFRSYLFSIAANCCRTALRRGRWREQVFARLDEDAPAIDPNPQPAETLIAAERHQLLHAAIDRLTETQRSVVLLYLLLATDYARIADILGKSPDTVRSHMHHALAALRGALTKIPLRGEGKVDHERQIH